MGPSYINRENMHDMYILTTIYTTLYVQRHRKTVFRYIELYYSDVHAKYFCKIRNEPHNY